MVGLGTVLLLYALARAVATAPSINCADNLKILRLCAASWSLDMHTNRMPAEFILFTNQLWGFGPKILHCPGDHEHTEAANWHSFTASNVSYALAGGGVLLDSTNVYARCLHHNTSITAEGGVLLGKAPVEHGKP
jgi:hypothetical protein